MNINSLFKKHVIQLEATALDKNMDEERRCEAIRSLCIIALLTNGWKPAE